VRSGVVVSLDRGVEVIRMHVIAIIFTVLGIPLLACWAHG
jgi:hypothetical protein